MACQPNPRQPSELHSLIVEGSSSSCSECPLTIKDELNIYIYFTLGFCLFVFFLVYSFSIVWWFCLCLTALNRNSREVLLNSRSNGHLAFFLILMAMCLQWFSKWGVWSVFLGCREKKRQRRELSFANTDCREWHLHLQLAICVPVWCARCDMFRKVDVP